MVVLNWRERLVSDITGVVLEIGVGAGANLTRYRQAAAVVALEPDPVRAYKARAAASRSTLPISIKIGVAEALPLAQASVDHVVSSLVFCSVTDPRLALREIRRVLKPGGVLTMLEHVRPQTPALAAAASAVTPYWRRIAHNCHLDRPTLAVLYAEGWRVSILDRRGVFVRLEARPE